MINTTMKRLTFTQLVEANMAEVYHITPEHNVPDIQKNGLQPRMGANSQEIGETIPAVHVFLDKETVEDALMNWDTMDWHDGEEDLSIITMRVPTDILVRPKGAMMGGVAEIRQVIPPSMITSIGELYM